jgi:hypothetical protein
MKMKSANPADGMVLMPWQSFFVCPELMDFPVVELITAVSLRAVWHSSYLKNLTIC